MTGDLNLDHPGLCQDPEPLHIEVVIEVKGLST